MIFALSLTIIVGVLWRVMRRLLETSPLDNIPGLRASSWWTGNFGLLFDSDRGLQYHQDISNKYGPVFRIHGPFGSRLLYVFDPKALQCILADKQANFDHSAWTLSRNRLVFGQSLFTVSGEQHRRHRRHLNPAFSTKNLKLLVPTIYTIAHQLRDAIREELRGQSGEVDVLKWTARAALEAITYAGCGYSLGSLKSPDQEHPVADALKDLVPALMDLNPFLSIITYVASMRRSWRRCLATMLPFARVQRLKRVADVLEANSRDILAGKYAQADTRGDFTHTDILSSLMQNNMNTDSGLTEEEIVSNLTSMLFGGTDTTSNSLALILQLLAEHPRAQDILRDEILSASTNGDILYERLVNLPYLDAVCRESLRLHALAPITLREATEDTELPFSRPVVGLDGTIMDSVFIPKGTTVLISVVSCHRNKEIWGEDALEWKPERWLSPLPDSVTKAQIPGVYSNLLTFLAGKRACLGFGFSQIEIKILLSVLISSFKFSLTDHKIVWKFAAVNFPKVEGHDSRVCLPLNVAALDS